MLCQVCGARCQPSAAVACPGCGALCYCGQQHLQLRQRCGHDAEECQRMKEQLARAQELLHHDLQWPSIKGPEDVHGWLQQLGCHSRGLLRWCCPLPACSSRPEQEQEQARARRAGDAGGDPVLPLTQTHWQDAWGLAGADLAPWAGACFSRQPAGQPLGGWGDYCALRHVARSSPAALALHFPLSLWHSLTQLLPSRGWPLPPAGATIRVAYLGPQVELHLLPAFLELAMLLPHHHLEVHFVGPDVPEQLHRRACQVHLPHAAACTSHPAGSLSMACWAACWHDVVEDWQQMKQDDQAGDSQAAAVSARAGAAGAGAGAAGPPPQAGQCCWEGVRAPPQGRFHLIFAPNAGLPAYASWLPSLQQLAATSGAGGAPAATQPASGSCRSGPPASGSCMPVVFSDYCEEAVHKSQELARGLLGCGFTLSCSLNPFRSPVPASSHGTALPACSNAFLFGWL